MKSELKRKVYFITQQNINKVAKEAKKRKVTPSLVVREIIENHKQENEEVFKKAQKLAKEGKLKFII